jgi:hypothetical protein
MLFLVALVGIQVPHLFQIAQQIHHQEHSLYQVVQKLVVLMELTDLVLMELNFKQELVAETLAVKQLGLEPAAPLDVGIGVVGRLLLGVFKKDTEHV